MTYFELIISHTVPTDRVTAQGVPTYRGSLRVVARADTRQELEDLVDREYPDKKDILDILQRGDSLDVGRIAPL